MKTIISMIITAMLLSLAAPLSAKNRPGVDGCSATAKARKGSKEKTHYRNVTNKHLEFKKQHRKFEKSKNHLGLRGTNPNKHSGNKHRSGGFYSFRRHSYSGHIFH